MTHECFQSQMARLRETYGAKIYGAGREELILKTARDLADHAFERIVSHFIANARQAPLPKDFQDAARSEWRGRTIGPEGAQAPIECRWCNDGGVVEVTHKGSGKEYFMRCGCEAHLPERDRDWRKHHRTEVPEWADDHALNFTRHEMFGARALKWKPKAFNARLLERSIQNKAEEWKLKMRVSAVFWAEQEPR